ncbi:MAG: hypothetical protein WC451_00890 [Patescibacteria group bacterium]|jgi:hypothetical protein
MKRDEIISAIQNQQMLRVSFRKETDGDWVTRTVAPYDIYKQTKSGEYFEQDILLGYAKGDVLHRSHVVSIYLNNIQSIESVGEHFDGDEIRRLIKPKHQPNIDRNW